MCNGLIIRERILPHWRLDYSTYFVTWCKQLKLGRLTELERDIVVESIMHFHLERYHIWAFAVMDDHVHVVVTPKGYALSKMLTTWKSYTARRINSNRDRSGPFWQAESYDRIIRNEGEFTDKLVYILENPLKRWPGIKSYKWADWTRDDFHYLKDKSQS